MSTCRRCGSPSFNLDRNSGEMACNNCGSPNYVGSPTTYNPGLGSKENPLSNVPDETIKGTYMENELFDPED